jgi:hypothetical protein
LDLRFTNRKNIVRRKLFGCHGEGDTVYEFVFKEDNRVGVANRSLEKALGILGIVRRQNFETGNRAVPSSKALRVLCGCEKKNNTSMRNGTNRFIGKIKKKKQTHTNTSGRTVGTSENDRAVDLTTRHV